MALDVVGPMALLPEEETGQKVRKDKQGHPDPEWFYRTVATSLTAGWVTFRDPEHLPFPRPCHPLGTFSAFHGEIEPIPGNWLVKELAQVGS